MSIATSSPHSGTAADPRRWLALASVAGAQLMVGLDLTIMNIALPSAQRDLHMSSSDRPWVITAFALAYGGLLLLGGRIGEAIGRKRALLIGIAGFGAASALGGAAVNTAMLLSARAGQGLFGALMTPSVLATLAATFAVPAERSKAFGIYGTAMGSASGIGVLLGGVLTQYLDWRWCMFVNAPIAIAAAVGVVYAVRPIAPVRRRVDIVGALLATAGLMAAVLGFAKAGTDGWSSGLTLGCLGAAVALLAVFTWTQTKFAAPLLPLRIVLDRRRAGSYIAVLSLAIGMFAALFFLTFYLQDLRSYSPVKAGLAFLPLTIGLMVGVRLVTPLLSRRSAVNLLPPGLLTLAGGLVLLAFADVDSGYWLRIMPVFLLLGLGTGWVLVTANSTATQDAGPDTSVAGAMVMTSQQIGASLGTALLSTIAVSATTSYLVHRDVPHVEAVVHGFNIASWWATGFLAAAALLVAIVLPTRRAAVRENRKLTDK